MAKKIKKRSNTDNSNQSSQNCKYKKSSSKSSNSKNSADNKKLSDFSYADLIILSAILSYSLAEDFDEDDLSIFLVFLGLLIAEMQTIVAQKAIQAKSQIIPDEDEDLDLEDEENIDLEE